MRILYLADPHSTHDQKWMRYFINRKGYETYLLPRQHHMRENLESTLNQADIKFLEPIADFSVSHFFKTIATARRIKRIVRDHHIDLLHIYYAEPNALWSIFQAYFDIPVVITTRGTDVLKTIPEAFTRRDVLNRIVAFLYRRAFLRASWVTSTSHGQILSIKRLKLRTEGYSIIRTGVDLSSIKADTASYFPMNDDVPYVFFPRLITPIYNHEFALEAIAKLSSSFKESFKMVFIGRDAGNQNYQEELEQMMQKLTDVRIEFLPKQQSQAMYELYKRASLVVMTPMSDGTPVSMMEASLSGCQSILGPLPYDSDILNPNVVQLSKWDSDELARLMEAKLDPPKTFTALTQEIIDRYSRDSNMERVALLYEQLLSREHGEV